MATWEDGPEYAPVERPSEFSMPSVPPLESPPPAPPMAAPAPGERPRFSDPAAPVAPLATLIPTVEETRDPSVPFEVVSSTVTSMEASSPVAWGSAHWSPPSGPPAPSGAGPWGPPGGTPWAAPEIPLHPASGVAPSPTGFPSPGTPQWFAPAPYGDHRVESPVDIRRVGGALTPGLVITLVIGGFLFFLAPITLGIGYVASTRVKVAKDAVRKVLLAALLGVGFFALVGVFTHDLSFGDWWSFVGLWSLALSWAALIASAGFVYRELRQPGPPASGYPSHWG